MRSCDGDISRSLSKEPETARIVEMTQDGIFIPQTCTDNDVERQEVFCLTWIPGSLAAEDSVVHL